MKININNALAFVFALALMLFLGSCGPAYVSTRPTYVQGPRPARPSIHHVWSDGEWIWNGRSRSYRRQDGVWMAPRGGRSFNQGHWNTNSRGHYWTRGTWR